MFHVFFLQDARFSMGIVTYQGLIYIVGGCTHSRRHMQVLSYNLKINRAGRKTISTATATNIKAGCFDMLMLGHNFYEYL